MSEVTICTELFKTLLIQSFRYCLGRRTYAASDCVEMLQQYWNYLPPFLQEQIHRDILHAIDVGWAGDNCDVEEWKELLELKVNDRND